MKPVAIKYSIQEKRQEDQEKTRRLASKEGEDQRDGEEDGENREHDDNVHESSQTEGTFRDIRDLRPVLVIHSSLA